MRNHYLDLLGLTPGASKQQIKSAYRSLSKRYHPDVSTDPQAKERFIRITEAYKFLTDVGPNPHREKLSYDYNPYESEYLRRRARARTYARKRAKEAARRHYQSLYKFHHIYKYAVGVFIGFNLLLGIDFNLPFRVHTETVSETTKVITSQLQESGARISYHRFDDIHFENYTMRFKAMQVNVPNGSEGVLYITPLLNKPRKVDLLINSHPVTYIQDYTIYDFYWWLIPIMLLLGLVYFQTPSLERKLSLGVIMFMIALLQYFLW